MRTPIVVVVNGLDDVDGRGHDAGDDGDEEDYECRHEPGLDPREMALDPLGKVPKDFKLEREEGNCGRQEFKCLKWV